MMENELQIIERIKAGDEDAFGELIDGYKERALKIAYVALGNYEDAKDVSQEAFIRVFKTIKHFRAECKFYTWLYRILINLCRDHLRKNKMKYKFLSATIRGDGDSQDEASIFDTIASSAPHPAGALLNKELGGKLSQAISSLPAQQKAIFTLKNLHGLKISEIAEITKCAQGTVKAHLFKATLNLQERLTAYAPGGAV